MYQKKYRKKYRKKHPKSTNKEPKMELKWRQIYIKNRCLNVVEKHIEKTLKKKQKSMRKWSPNWWKLMKNRRRNGRRRRDEKRTFEVWISIKISNSRILKIYEKHNGFIGVFEFRPFRFEGPAQTKTFKKLCQKTLKNTCFSWKNDFKIIQKQRSKKVSNNHRNLIPKWSQKWSKNNKNQWKNVSEKCVRF